MELTAQEAYAEAERRVEAARAKGSGGLNFSVLPNLEDLPPLNDLPNVLHVILDRTQISDLTPIAALPHLVVLSLAGTQVSSLEPLQHCHKLETINGSSTLVKNLTPISALRSLTELYLSHTPITDISPLQNITMLRYLILWDTSVADISSLKSLSYLTWLNLEGTEVRDLRPIAQLGFNQEVQDLEVSLDFRNTPAAASSPELTELSKIKNDTERTQKILAYLRSLPPYPEPLPWDVKPSRSAPTTITVPQLLEAQDSAGWRFSPDHGAMSLYIQDKPLEERQTQLAKMAAERVKHLLEKNGPRNTSGGLRQEVAEEAARFADILNDTSRSLASRSLDLWGSLLALGGHLEANDTGKREGRDPLDQLTGEARTSLQTFLGIAGNLVRSFPEARAMDDGNADFTRRAVTTDMVLALLEEALRSRFVDEKSGALIQHVAGVSLKSGTQADKAFSSTATGGRNLAFAAILSAPFLYTADGIASGILSDIGTDISNHQELGERANTFIDNARDQIEAMLDNSPPDEAARMRSALEDLTRNKGPR